LIAYRKGFAVVFESILA